MAKIGRIRTFLQSLFRGAPQGSPPAAEGQGPAPAPMPAAPARAEAAPAPQAPRPDAEAELAEHAASFAGRPGDAPAWRDPPAPDTPRSTREPADEPPQAPASVASDDGRPAPAEPAGPAGGEDQAEPTAESPTSQHRGTEPQEASGAPESAANLASTPSWGHPMPTLSSPPPVPSISPEAVERLARLPKALNELSEALATQSSLTDRLQEVLTALSEPNQDLIQAMEGLASESQKQTDMLQNLAESIAERHQFDVQASEAVSRLPAMLEGLQKSNAALIETMERIRDRWASARDDLAQEIVRQGRRVSGLVIAAVVLLGVQTVIFLLALLM